MSSIVVIDNFYRNPKSLRKKAFSMDFVEPEDLVGWRTKKGLLSNNIADVIYAKSGLVVKSMQMPQGTPYDNGVIFLSFSSGNKKEKPGIHWDLPLNEMLCLVYLTEGIPVECGTSILSTPKNRSGKRANGERCQKTVLDEGATRIYYLP